MYIRTEEPSVPSFSTPLSGCLAAPSGSTASAPSWTAVLFFPYDWRKSNATSAASLAIAINNTYDNVILVAHSMGGLVASKYCANSSANRGKVDKLITIGTPYTGSPQLVYVAETGDFNPLLSNSKIKELVVNFPAVYQLIPTVRYQCQYFGFR